MAKNVEECFSLHKENIQDGTAAILYGMQGMAYENLGEYKEAIRAYVNGAYYYIRIEDLGGQANMMCSMGNCYRKSDRQIMASTYYKKGFNKYLEYFDTTRSRLLRGNFYVKEGLKQKSLAVFAEHLVQMAIYEQDYGSRSAMKEYLLMSAHCGSDFGKEEYNRLFGY